MSFENRNYSFSSSHGSLTESLCSSFSSNPSVWDSTPSSSRRESIDSTITSETIAASTPGSIDVFATSGGYNPGLPVSDFSLNTTIYNEGGRALTEANMSSYNPFPNFNAPSYNSFDGHHPFVSNQNMRGTQGDLLSNSGDMGCSQGYIDMQTIHPYDLQSPGLISLETSPVSEYGTDFSTSSSPLGITSSYGDSCSFRSESTTPSRSSSIRQPTQVTQTSLDLQRAQLESSAVRLGMRKKGGRIYSLPGSHLPPIGLQGKAMKKCQWPGCIAKFQRQEHLKRHEKTHGPGEPIPCDFCSKKFGRSDNLKSHIKLHFETKRKASRTKFFPEAEAVYNSMQSKSKSKKSAEPDTVRVKLEQGNFS